MWRFLLRRSFGAVATFFVILTLSFFLVKAAPGGPFDRERSFSPEVMAKLEAKYNLNEPLWMQYYLYVKRIAFQFDLGPSTQYADRSVNELIGAALPISFKLGGGALVIAILLGILSGLLASLNHNTKLDYAPMSLAMIGVSIPDFVLANILVLIFALWLGWFPAAMVVGWQGFILPCVTLGLVYAASIARLTRGGMLEILGKDFIRTARAKGLDESKIVWRHSLKGGLLPTISYLGPATAGIMTGSVVIEKVFALPGLGRLLIDSATNRDYTLALGCVIVFASLILLLNILVDLLYAFLDPRVKYG